MIDGDTLEATAEDLGALIDSVRLHQFHNDQQDLDLLIDVQEKLVTCAALFHSLEKRRQPFWKRWFKSSSVITYWFRIGYVFPIYKDLRKSTPSMALTRTRVFKEQLPVYIQCSAHVRPTF